jgi:hypothetical protein
VGLMMKIDRKIQKEIALAVLNIIEPNFSNLSKQEQAFLFNNMKKGVHKFILKEYHRRQKLVEEKNY